MDQSGVWWIMFRGSSYHTIDPKGRIIIPSRFREPLKNGDGSSAMVSKFDGGLVAYALDEWEKVEQKILSLAQTSDNMRRFRRVFIGGAFECRCDKQDRILIPPSLRDYALLKKEIVMVGVLNKFEIWSRERWDAENTILFEDLQKEDVRNEIAQLGL